MDQALLMLAVIGALLAAVGYGLIKWLIEFVQDVSRIGRPRREWDA